MKRRVGHPTLIDTVFAQLDAALELLLHLCAERNSHQVVYNHWTGLVDWTGGLTFFVLKITFVLSCETSLSCRFRHDAF